MQSPASLAHFNSPNQKRNKFFIKLQEYLLPVLTIFSIQETLLVGTQTSYFTAYRFTRTPFIFCNSCNHYCLPCQVSHTLGLTCDLGFTWSSCTCIFCNTLHPLAIKVFPLLSFSGHIHLVSVTLLSLLAAVGIVKIPTGEVLIRLLSFQILIMHTNNYQSVLTCH